MKGSSKFLPKKESRSSSLSNTKLSNSSIKVATSLPETGPAPEKPSPSPYLSSKGSERKKSSETTTSANI